MSEHEQTTRVQLLEPKEKDISDFIIPGLIGLAGAAIIYKSLSKKKDNDEKAPAPEAKNDDIVFSSDYSSYSIGKDWESLVLEPFLAEQAEEENLVTLSFAEESKFIEEPFVDEVLNTSRNEVLDIFRSTHKVTAPSGRILISNLPDKSSVKKFNEWLESQVKNFQEEY